MTLLIAEDRTLVAFTVLGEAKSAGSKRAFRHPHTGRTIVTEAVKGSRQWQQEVKTAARDAVPEDFDLLTGPLAVEMTFYKPRPASHYGTGRNSGSLRESAPPFPATRPDTTKLVRGVEDACTGVVWRDDAQIVTQVAHKRYDAPARCEVRIYNPQPQQEVLA